MYCTKHSYFDYYTYKIKIIVPLIIPIKSSRTYVRYSSNIATLNLADISNFFLVCAFLLQLVVFSLVLAFSGLLPHVGQYPRHAQLLDLSVRLRQRRREGEAALAHGAAAATAAGSLVHGRLTDVAEADYADHRQAAVSVMLAVERQTAASTRRTQVLVAVPSDLPNRAAQHPLL